MSLVIPAGCHQRAPEQTLLIHNEQEGNTTPLPPAPHSSCKTPNKKSSSCGSDSPTLQICICPKIKVFSSRTHERTLRAHASKPIHLMPDSGGSLHDDGSPLQLLCSSVQVQLLTSFIIGAPQVNCETRHAHTFMLPLVLETQGPGGYMITEASFKDTQSAAQTASTVRWRRTPKLAL